MSLLLDKSHLLLLVFLQLLRHPILVLHQLLRHPILEFLILLQYPILSSQKTTISQKGFLYITLFFTLFVLSRAFDNTTSQTMGGRMHGPSPPQILGGPSPQFPLG